MRHRVIKIVGLVLAIAVTGCQQKLGVSQKPSSAVDASGTQPGLTEEAVGETPLKVGSWASDQMSFDVYSTGANLMLGCGGGSISEPIVLNSHGEFVAKGIYQAGGGALPIDGFPSYPVTFKGVVKDEVMTLVIEMEGNTSTAELVFGYHRKNDMIRCL